MSYGDPMLCRNKCGAWIYFDVDSKAGHPSADKWLPLEYNHDSGIRTGQVHQCPKRSNNGVRIQQQKQQQQQVQDNNPLAPVSDESVERGITAFTMMTDLIKEVEDVKKEVKHVREILGNQERLFNQMLVWVQQMRKQ